jgi:ATP-dependent Clp protease adaptor protein ClpS
MGLLSWLLGDEGPAATDDPPGVPQYNLVLLNDETHTFEFAIALLRDVFGLPWNEAFELTLDIHDRGRQIVFTGSQEEIESKRVRVAEYGTDPRLASSTGPIKSEIAPEIAP